MSAHAMVFDVCVALLAGAKLHTDRFVVGPAPAGFVCFDLHACRAVKAPEVHDVATSLGGPREDRRGSGAMFEPVRVHDYTPFGAASAFVRHTEERDVEAALAAWKGARR